MNTNPVPLVVGDHLTTVQLRVTIALMGTMLDEANEVLAQMAAHQTPNPADLLRAHLSGDAARRYLEQVTRLLDGEDRTTVHLPREQKG